MQQNLARMRELDLHTTLDEIKSASKQKSESKATQRGVSLKKQRSMEQGPPRRSGRLQGSGPDPETAAGIDVQGGQLVKVAGEWIRVKAQALVAAAEEDTRVTPGPLDVKSSNCNARTDAEFLR